MLCAGPVGSGRSTALAWLAWEEASSAYRGAAGGLVPVGIDPGGWPRIPGSVLLICDDTSDAVEALLLAHPNLHVVTTRSDAFAGPPDVVVEFREWATEVIRAFLVASLGPVSERETEPAVPRTFVATVVPADPSEVDRAFALLGSLGLRMPWMCASVARCWRTFGPPPDRLAVFDRLVTGLVWAPAAERAPTSVDDLAAVLLEMSSAGTPPTTATVRDHLTTRFARVDASPRLRADAQLDGLIHHLGALHVDPDDTLRFACPFLEAGFLARGIVHRADAAPLCDALATSPSPTLRAAADLARERLARLRGG